MDEKELTAAIKVQITSATGFMGGELSEQRVTAMRDYLGQPMGNEIDGRSQVVSSDVQDVIESVMPDVIQIFTSSNKAVEFEPVGQEDQEGAEQATDYVNHVWNKDNPGFNIFYDWFKDAFLAKNGIIKIWFDKSERTERRSYTGLTGDQVILLKDSEGVEIIEHSEEWSGDAKQFLAHNGIPEETDTDALPPELVSQGRVHSVTILRKTPRNRTKVDNVPPEEFLISRRARNLADAPFKAHRTSRTASDLIADGYDKTQIEEMPEGDGQEFSQEKVNRFNNTDDGLADEEADKSMREITVHECYMRVDWDGDGIAELRKITVGGPAYEILKFKDGKLDNEEIDDDPFASVTPIRMPHKFFGRSLSEIVQDIQYIKTSIWRQLLDNMYNVNNARSAISNRVSLDDYLDNKVGAPIRVDADGNIGGHILPIQTAPIGNHAFPLLEYVDNVRETRSGVSRLGQGLDPDALHSTARGINQLLGRTQQRTLLIAQVFAFGGVRDAFKKILKLEIENQDKARTIRLRNKWVEMDPRVWNAEMDVTVNVGLGRGTQDQRIVTTSKVIESTNALATIQGGIAGPFVYPQHIRNAYAEFYEAVGLRSADPYLAPISEQEGAQIAQQASQQPNPEMMKLELQKQKQDQDHEDRMAEHDTNARKVAGDHHLQMTEAQLVHIRELEKMDRAEAANEAKLDLQAYIAAGKFHADREKTAVQEGTKRIALASKPEPVKKK